MAIELPERTDPILTARGMLDLMAPRYPDMSARVWIAGRLVVLLLYLTEHTAAFDVDEYGAPSEWSAGAPLSRHVLRALHEVLTEGTTFPTRLPSPEEILNRARDFRMREEQARAVS